MVHENEQGERDDSSAQGTPPAQSTPPAQGAPPAQSGSSTRSSTSRPRRHRAARRPAGPPVLHPEQSGAEAALAADVATAEELGGMPHDQAVAEQAVADGASDSAAQAAVGSALSNAADTVEDAGEGVDGDSQQDAAAEDQPPADADVEDVEDVEVATQNAASDLAQQASSDEAPATGGADSEGEPGDDSRGAVQPASADSASGDDAEHAHDTVATHPSDAPEAAASNEAAAESPTDAPETDASHSEVEDEDQPAGDAEVETATSAASAESAAPDSDDQSPDEPEEHPRSRRSRRATRGVVTAAFSSQASDAPAQATRPAERPAPALFQAPDLTATRTGATDGAADTPTVTEPAEQESDGGAPPVAGRRSRRATRAAGAPVQVVEPEPAEAATLSVAEDSEQLAGDEDEDLPRRRRRRGGRRRRRTGQGPEDVESSSDDDEPIEGRPEDAQGESAAASDEAAGEPAEAGSEDEAAASEDDDAGTGRRRRRRRRRAGVAEEMEDLSSDDPPNTVTKVRESRRPSDEVIGVRGSTRIEAKKQRRRDGREAGRRRAPILTEAEFLARREAVNRVMCVRQRADRTQIAVLEDGILVEHYVNRADSSSMVGNVYLGKVQNVLPSMEAAFVDIGRGRNAVLYAGEVNWDAAGLEGQPKRIELALKSGDPVLVQVTKDPIGHKGARLTSQISLPGRFLVYVPEGSMTGISRKLPDTERARLKGILKDVVPEGAGVIVRTAAEGATEEQLTADVQRLTDEWADIQRKAKSSTPPTLLYGEPDLAIKVVRDIFNEDFTTLLVQGDATSRTLRDYIGRVAPDLLGRVEQWTDTDDLYVAHRIDEQLAKALDRKVWLPSGGSLVIDRTEAMTVVDVNTGKFTGQGGNLEETVTRNNLEAAEEIVRQLRLRDIGGIIVIDFIDMVLESNRDLVLRRLVECLGRDRTKHQVAEVTSLGLVQMTRKRIGQGLLEVFSTPCEACGGRGHVVHTEPVGSGAAEDSGRGRERGNNRRNQRPAPQVNLGGKQTGKTPPPPKFDEHGHIDHSGEHAEEHGEAQPFDGDAVAEVPEVAVESGPVEVVATEGTQEAGQDGEGLPSESAQSHDDEAAESVVDEPEDFGTSVEIVDSVASTEILVSAEAVDPGSSGRPESFESTEPLDTAQPDVSVETQPQLTLVEDPATGDGEALELTGEGSEAAPADALPPSGEEPQGDGDEHGSDATDHPDQASASPVVV